MSSELAISVHGLSKQYTVHDTGAWSLKSAILHLPAYLRQQRQQTAFWAVQNVTFDVAKGEFFSIIGANGSGKSTLLRMLAGLSKPSAGTIATSGNVSSLLELGSGFHPSVSGRENAVMNGLLMGLSRVEIDEVMPAIVEFSGLAEFIDQPMRTYSSGMYLRLGFAIATALEPDVLVVDEVLAVGDSQFQDRCYAHIDRLKARGATVVMVSHDLNAVERLSSRVALMEQGNLVAVGDPHDTVAEHLERLINSSPEIRRSFVETLEERILTDPVLKAEFDANLARKWADEEKEKVTGTRVAILTVTTNAAEHLPAYLQALGNLTHPERQLWVVDNGSTDGSPETVEAALSSAKVLRNDENLGFTGACNRGLAAIQDDGWADFVLFLNDDTEAEPGFLEPLLAIADSRTLVAPKTYLAGTDGLLDDSVGDFDWWRGTWKKRVYGRQEPSEYGYVHAIGTANLSALLIPISALRAVGGLDDAFFVYYDDTDFCRRAAEAGFRILFQPASVVHHVKGATLGGQLSPFGCYYLSRNRPYLIRKHYGRGPRFWAFFAYFLATRTARSLAWAAQRRWDLVGATMHGVADFSRGRMGRGRLPG